MMTPNVKKLREVCNETESTQQLTPGLKLLDGTPILPGTALKGIRELKRTPPKIHNVLRPTSTEEISGCEQDDGINAISGDFWYVNIKTPAVQLPKEEKAIDLLDFALVKDGKFPTGRALERSPVRLSASHELFDGHVPESPLEVREVFIEPGSRIPRTPLHASTGRPSAACDLVIHYSRNRTSGAKEMKIVSNEDKENVKKVKPRKRSVSSNNIVPTTFENSSLSLPADEANIFKPQKRLARTPIKQQSVVPVTNGPVALESKSPAHQNKNAENNQSEASSPPKFKEITRSLSPEKVQTYEHISGDRQIFQRSKKLARTPVKSSDSTHKTLPIDGDTLSVHSTEAATSKLESFQDISEDKSIFQRSKKLSRTPVKGGDSTNAHLPLVSEIHIQNGGDASDFIENRNCFDNQQNSMDSNTNNSNENGNPLSGKEGSQNPIDHQVAEHATDDNSVTALVMLRPSVNSLKPPKNIIPKGKQLMRTPPSGKFQRQEGDGNSVAPSLSTVEECLVEDPTAIFMAQLRNNEPLPNRAAKKKPFLKSNKSKIVLNNNQLKKSKSSNKLDVHEHSKERKESEMDSKKNEVHKSVISAIPRDRRLTYKVSDDKFDKNIKESAYIHDHTQSKTVAEKLQDPQINKSRKLTYVVQHENLTDMKTGDNIPQPSLLDEEKYLSKKVIKDLKQNVLVNPVESVDDSMQESDTSLLCLDELCDKSLNFCDDLFEEALERKKSLNNNACSTKTNVISISYCLDSPLKSDLLSSIGVSKIQVGDTPSQSNEPVNVMNSSFDVIANSDSDEDFFDACEDIPSMNEQTEKSESSSIPMNSTFEISKSPPRCANSTFDVEPNPSDTFSMEQCTEKDEIENKNATFDIEPTKDTPEIRVLNDTFDMDISDDTNSNQILNSTYDENSKLDKPRMNMELDSPNRTLENTASTVIENITPNKTVECENESSTKDDKSFAQHSASKSDLETSAGKKSDKFHNGECTSNKASFNSEISDEGVDGSSRNNRIGNICKTVTELKEGPEKTTETKGNFEKANTLKLSSSSDKCDDIEEGRKKPLKKSSRKTTKSKKAEALIVNNVEVLTEEPITSKDDDGSPPEMESKEDKEVEILNEKDSESNEDSIKPIRLRRRKAKILKSSDLEHSDCPPAQIQAQKEDDIDVPTAHKRDNDEKNDTPKEDKSERGAKDVSSDYHFEKKEEKSKQRKGRTVKKKSVKECPSPKNINDATDDENNVNLGEKGDNVFTEDNNVPYDDKDEPKSRRYQKSNISTTDENDCEGNLAKEKNKPKKTKKKMDDKIEEQNDDLCLPMKQLTIERPTRRQPRRNRKIVDYTETSSPHQIEYKSRSIVNNVDKVKSTTEIEEDICGKNEFWDLPPPSQEDEHKKEAKREIFDDVPDKNVEKLRKHELTREVKPTYEKPVAESTMDEYENEKDMEIKPSQVMDDNVTQVDNAADKPVENADIKTNDNTNEQKVTRRKPAPRSKLLSIRASFGLIKNTCPENKPKENVTGSGDEKEMISDSNQKVVSDITEKLNEVSIEDAASKPRKAGKPGRKPKATNIGDCSPDDAKTTSRSVGRRVLSRCKKFTGSYDESSVVEEKKKRVTKCTPYATSKENVCSRNNSIEDNDTKKMNTAESELGLNKLPSGLFSGPCMELPPKSNQTGPPKVSPEQPSLKPENVFITESNENGNVAGSEQGELISKSKDGGEIIPESTVLYQENDNTDAEKTKKEKKIKRLSGIPMGLGVRKTRKDANSEDLTIAKSNALQEKQPIKSKPTSTKAQPNKLEGLRKSFGFTANKPALRNSVGHNESSVRPSLATDRKISPNLENSNNNSTTVPPVKSFGVRGVKQGKIAGVALESVTTTTEKTAVPKKRVVNQKTKASTKATGNNTEVLIGKGVTTTTSIAKAKRALKKEESKPLSSVSTDGDKGKSSVDRRKKVPVKKGVRNPSIESPTVSVSDSYFTESMSGSKVQNPKPRKRQKKDDQVHAVELENNLCATASDERVPTVEVLQDTECAMEDDQKTKHTDLTVIKPETSEYKNPGIYNEDESVQDVNEKTTKKVKRLSFIPICRGAVPKAKTTEDQSGKTKDLDKAVEGINILQISSPIKATRGVRKGRTTRPQRVDNQASPEKKDSEPKKRGRKKKEETLEVADVDAAVPDMIEDKTKSGKGRTSIEEQIYEIEQQLDQLNAQKDVSPQTDLQISRLEAKLVKLQEKVNASKVKQTTTRSLRSTRLKKDLKI